MYLLIRSGGGEVPTLSATNRCVVVCVFAKVQKVMTGCIRPKGFYTPELRAVFLYCENESKIPVLCKDPRHFHIRVKTRAHT